jgi:hypothetical protein
MAQFTEHDAENLSPEQATALVGVLNLQAKWDGLLADKGPKTGLSELHARQKANDAYQTAIRDYTTKYRNPAVPEPTQAMPDRLAVWCRVLRVVFGKAEGGSPAQVMGKVYRLADRITARVGNAPVARGSGADLPAAVRDLDVVIAWCDGLATPAPARAATL